jgi:hypothetical protein
LLYLVHWASYEGTNKETSWIVATELDHASKLVMDLICPILSNPDHYPNSLIKLFFNKTYTSPLNCFLLIKKKYYTNQNFTFLFGGDETVYVKEWNRRQKDKPHIM